MNTELQNKAWSILPKEYKEEVKYCYKTVNAQYKKNFYLEVEAAPIRDRIIMLEYLFGIHNLTSDAEGEDEMLCVSRKQIDALQGEIFKAIMDAHDADDWQDAAHYILDVMPRSFAALFGSKCLPDETKQETKQEPNFFQNGNTSHYSGKHFADVRKMVDTRLHIAAMVMAGALANKNVTIGCSAFEDNMEYITKTALMYADALIAECEKGGKNA